MYVPQLIREGHSATSALEFLRDQGHAIADATFYRLWGETVDQLSKRGALVDTPLHRKPTPDQIGRATRPRARGILTNVEIAVHDPHTGEVSFHAWGVRSQDTISIGNAIRRAVDSWTEAQQRGRNTPEGRALGGMVTSVLRLVGEDEI